MSLHWDDCVVTYIDLIGTTKSAATGEASRLMRRLHGLVAGELAHGALPSIAHAYVWNDSVLVLSPFSKHDRALNLAALRDVSSLKAAIDEKVCRSFAILVKGQPFATPINVVPDSRVVVLKTSSWAMANCFHVEAKLKRCKATWYVDSRIKKTLALRPSYRSVRVYLYPKQSVSRRMHLYMGDIFDEAGAPAPILAIPASVERISRLEQAIRDCVNDGTMRRRRSAGAPRAWARFAIALDTIGDACLALEHVQEAGIPSERGQEYLHIYGFFQAVIVQQDAIRTVWEFASQRKLDWKRLRGWARIRDRRVRSVGHPVDRVSGISRATIGPAVFEAVEWTDGERRWTFERVAVLELLEAHVADAVVVLEEALRHLEAEEQRQAGRPS